VETINRSFKQPLVNTLAGGKHGGGTQLTATSELVVQRYQFLCIAAQAAVKSGCDELAELLAEPVTAPYNSTRN
jgi:molybdate transport system regulatory protein